MIPIIVCVRRQISSYILISCVVIFSSFSIQRLKQFVVEHSWQYIFAIVLLVHSVQLFVTTFYCSFHFGLVTKLMSCFEHGKYTFFCSPVRLIIQISKCFSHVKESDGSYKDLTLSVFHFLISFTFTGPLNLKFHRNKMRFPDFFPNCVSFCVNF